MDKNFPCPFFLFPPSFSNASTIIASTGPRRRYYGLTRGWRGGVQDCKEGWGQEWDKDNIQEEARQRATTALVAAALGVEDTRRADRKTAARADEEAAGMVILLDAPM